MKSKVLFSVRKMTESHFYIMNPETDVIINIQTSCTRDEAVAKLLGWSRGRYFPRSVRVTEHGIDMVDLDKVALFEGSVQEQLAAIYERARSEFIAAAEAGESHDVLSYLENRVHECRALVDKAADYFLDLDDQLAVPDVLRIDQMKTEKDGQIWITIKSLAEWSKRKYNIDIMKVSDVNADLAAKVLEPEDYSGQGTKLTEADKLNITLAAMMGVLAETNAYKKGSGDANVSAISKKMAQYIAKELPYVGRGFGHETLDDRLVAAKAAWAKVRRL